MITATRAYKASDGTVYNSLEEVKVAELTTIATSNLSASSAETTTVIANAVSSLVAASTQVMAILKVKERKPRTVKPKAPKAKKEKAAA